MDDEQVRLFFMQPTQTIARHYEILRAYFVEQRTLADLADAFALNYYTVRNLVRRFRDQFRDGQVPPFLWSPASDALLVRRMNRLGRLLPLLRTAGSCSCLPADVCVPVLPASFCFYLCWPN